MTGKAQDFPKEERLTRRKEYLRVSGQPDKTIKTKHFLALLKKSESGRTRLGVTVTKKTGGAVIRNRVKRRVREFFRLHKQSLPQGYDVVVIAFRDAGELEQEQVCQELKRLTAVEPA